MKCMSFRPLNCISNKIFCCFPETGFNSHSISQSGRLNYENFDMTKVVKNSAHLMGSEGREYDLEEENTG